jgi:Helix-turn-helix domain
MGRAFGSTVPGVGPGRIREAHGGPDGPDLEPSSSLKAYFGWRLRHWRNVRGLTQRQLGDRTGDSDDEISKVGTAERWPPPGLAERCDRELGTGGELAALWPLVEAQRTTQVGSQVAKQSGATIHMGRTEEEAGGQEVRPVPSRREVVGYLGAGMAALVTDRMLSNPIVAALDAKHRAGASALAPGAVEDLGLTAEKFRLSYGRAAAWRWPFPRHGSRVHRTSALESEASRCARRSHP